MSYKKGDILKITDILKDEKKINPLVDGVKERLIFDLKAMKEIVKDVKVSDKGISVVFVDPNNQKNIKMIEDFISSWR